MPDVDRLIIAGRGQVCPVPAPADSGDPIAVPLVGEEQGACQRLPDAHRPVVGRAGQVSSIG